MDAWETYVREHDDEAPEALRQVMRHLVSRPRANKHQEPDTFLEPPIHQVADRADLDPKKAVKVLFTQSEYAALQQIADQRECSVQFWIISLVRAALTKGITVGGAELETLGRSNYQLMAIGRNLNQIAHQINRSPDRHMQHVTPELIGDLTSTLLEHRRHVGTLIRACTHRWRLKD